jgi:cell wall-associated NlpC family hydrolase
MNTIAWVFILASLIIARSVARGRALNLPEDLSDAFSALVRGNYDDLSAALGRTGDSKDVAFGDAVAQALSGPAMQRLTEAQRTANTNLAYWAYKLGDAASGYRFGSAGPKYYDCSGLMYRAAQKVGYKGPRFWTGSVAAMPGMHRLASTGMGISQVSTGDLVVWPGHHMGVVVGQNRFYSALNPKDGIQERPIDGFRKGETPIYLRFSPSGTGK